MQAEIGSRNFRFYMDLEVWGEFFQDDRGPGGMPIAVGTDIINDPFDFLPAHEVVEKTSIFYKGSLIIRYFSIRTRYAGRRMSG